MLLSRSPFLAATEYLSLKKVEALDYNMPENLDEDVADLIRRLLVRMPL